MTELALFLLGTGGAGGWYCWTGYVKRTKPCRHCGGYGYNERRSMFSARASQCKKCGGTGQSLRAAARHVQRKRAARGRRTGQARRAAATW
jgi:DnaJ-class molecular chaperone